MRLQKTSDNISGKTALETSIQKTSSKATAEKKITVAQTAKPTASASSKTPQSATQQAATRSVSSLISAAGLPSDKLSASIISFARFFSLPLKPELLKHIRQQAFTNTPNVKPPNTDVAAKNSAPETGTVLKNREVLSLAASAAEGKGVELQPKGLETYAQAIDPELRRKQDGGQSEQRGQRKKNGDDNENDNDSEETSFKRTAAISAGSLEKMALEMMERNPLLEILNRLPEKDGKRWIVLPFDFSDNDREFKVSLRILLETGETENRACCMALDIAIRGISENGRAEKRRLFVLEPANRLSVCLEPEITPVQQTALVRELSALPGITPERIYIKTKKESFPFEAEFGDTLLRSIDEAV